MEKGQGKRQLIPKIFSLHKLYICRIVHMWGRWAMTADCQLAAFFGRCSLKPIPEFFLIYPGFFNEISALPCSLLFLGTSSSM